MDKETLSNYGWIVICVLVLAVMIALATPFGQFISDAVWNTANGLFDTNNNALDNVLDDLGVVPTPEQLQAKYKFEYYSTLNGAVNDVNNGTIGTNADADKEDAVAGIYTNAGQTYVVLLKDTTEATRVQPTVDVTINLGGHTWTTIDLVAFNAPRGSSADVTIDGRLNGSTIKITADGKAGRPIQIYSGNVFITGGTYISDTNNFGITCISVLETGNLTISNASIISTVTNKNTYGIYVDVEATAKISDCTISAETNMGVNEGTDYSYCIHNKGSTTISNCTLMVTANNGQSRGVENGSSGTINISDCDISAIMSNGNSYGVINFGAAIVSNSEIKAYANYLYGDESYYGSASQGILNKGTLTLNNCYARGTHSGVESIGTLYVNGGTYEGYGHGGFYFGGTGATSYVRNATIRECPMPDGYTCTAGDNNAGFYIGGNVGNDNITVYMDNCDIYGSAQPIVLRGSAGEQNNSLYISNSKINTDRNIRIDNDTHKLYIGVGNNFTADNTGRPSAVITTNETYTQK